MYTVLPASDYESATVGLRVYYCRPELGAWVRVRFFLIYANHGIRNHVHVTAKLQS